MFPHVLAIPLGLLKLTSALSWSWAHGWVGSEKAYLLRYGERII